MKKKVTARPAKATSRQSTLNFPTSSEADLVAESAAAETSTKSGVKNGRKRTADFADDADKHTESHCDSSAISAQSVVKTKSRREGTRITVGRPSWSNLPLSDVVHSIDQGWSPRCENYAASSHSEWAVIKTTAIQNLQFLDQENKVLPSTLEPRKHLELRPGDLLITRAGPRNRVGVACLVRSTRPRLMLCDKAYRLKCRLDVVEPAFLELALNSPDLVSQVNKLKTGINDSGVNITQTPFMNLEIPVPTIAEQHRIVAEIEKQFTRLDAGVAALKRVQANLKRYRAAVLKAACEGKLVPTEAELARQEGRTYETGEQLLQRILTERRQNWQGSVHYKDPSVADTTNLPALPHGWTWATPDQLAAPDIGAICAGPFGTIFKAHDFRPEGIPIIFLRHVAPGRYLTRKPGFMDVARWEELFQPYSVFGGELLVTKLGEPPGVCAIFPEGIGPAMVTPDVIKMTPNTNAAFPKFLMHYFNSQTARDFATGVAFGTTRLRLTLPIFREMPVPLPPHSEQTRIVAEVERRLSVTEELEAVACANIERATRLRRSVLQMAFNGSL